MGTHKRNRSLPRKSSNLSIRDIYIGEIDTTIELDVGGNKASSDFYNSYFVRDESELNDFISGKKYFVYGQKGAGKTAFLRYSGETIRRRKDLNGDYVLYRFSRDFPKEAHRDITEFISNRQKSIGIAKETGINIFRDIDYEEFWTFLILERVNNFLKSDGSSMVAKDHALDAFRSMLANIDKGSIIDRILRLVPKPQRAQVQLSATPSASIDLEFTGKTDDLDKFSHYVEELKKRFFQLHWVSGFVNFMFDEIDPRVGSGKSFDLDCILIRDLIITIYRLNAQNQSERRIVFSAAIRSEVLRSVDKLGKEIHKILPQLGIHMNWGGYGVLDENHPLIKMLCKKLVYSESRNGIYNHAMPPTNEAMWQKYFRKTTNDNMSVRELFKLTWFRPRDLVRILNIAKNIDGESKFFSQSLIDRGKLLYANQSWGEIQSQLVTALGPSAIEALELVLTRFVDEFTLRDLQRRIDEMAVINSSVSELKESMKVGDLLEIMYLNGIVGNKEGSFHRFFFRGNTTPQLMSGFVLHAGLRKRFSPQYRSLSDATVTYKNGEFDF